MNKNNISKSKSGAAVGSSALLGHSESKYKIAELLMWYREQNQTNDAHHIVPVNITGSDIWNIKELPQMLLQSPSGGCPIEPTKASPIVNDVALGKTSLYEKVRQAFHSVVGIFHKRVKWPNGSKLSHSEKKEWR